jgi:hypothetical protein
MLGRRSMMVRRGPGLLGTVARTAVVAGTASAVVGGVNRRQQQKHATQDAQTAEGAQGADQYAAAPAPAAQADAGGGDDIARLQQLGKLRDAGVLTEEEFSAEKAKVLSR